MSPQEIEEIAEKAYYTSLCKLSPVIAKDPKWKKYWAAVTDEFRQTWRDIVVLVIEEYKKLPTWNTLDEWLSSLNIEQLEQTKRELLSTQKHGLKELVAAYDPDIQRVIDKVDAYIQDRIHHGPV